MRPAPDQATDKIALLEDVADAWNARGIEYAVCHGIEGYPRAAGRDLDVIVRGSHLREALRVAAESLRSRGCIVSTPPNPWGARWLFASREGTRFEIDLIPFLFRGPALIVGAPQPTGWIGPFRVDPWASFAKRVLMPILGKVAPKEPLLGPGEEAVALNRCRKLFGSRLARQLLTCLNGRDLGGLGHLAARLRAASVARALCFHPMRSLGLFPSWVRKSVLPWFTRCAPIVALVGPDGVGKSAALSALLETSAAPFCGFVARHWRPGVLPAPASLIGRPVRRPDARGLLPPPRKPGRFHWLRLAYYFVDFTLGHFLRDCRDSSRLQVVVYDRHALDMCVDPVRYGLSSARGTRLLWRLIPRPDLVVLLFDDPLRIRSRKAELTAEDIAMQLQAWLGLAREGHVGAITRVEGGPEQTAKAVKDLIFEAFAERRRGGGRTAGYSSGGDLSASTLPAACGRGARPGRITAFGRIGLRDGREYLVPLGSRRAALNALQLYRPQKKAARLALTLLSTAIGCGAGRLLMPGQSVSAPRQAESPGSRLLDHLQEILGADGLTVGVSLGLPGPQRKPVLMLMNREGRPLGFAKVASSDQARRLIENEKRALDYFGECAFEHGIVPGVIHCGEWQGQTILVTEPIDLGANRRAAPPFQDVHVRFLVELAGKGPRTARFAESSFAFLMQARIELLRGSVPDVRLRTAERAVGILASTLDRVRLPWVWRTGDFVPWNVGIDAAKSRVAVVDLEYAAPESVPGWDLFHYLSRSGTALPGGIAAGPAAPGRAASIRVTPTQPGRAASGRVAPGNLPPGATMDYFRALDIDPGLIPALLAAYFLDLWTMREELWVGTPKPGHTAALLRRMSSQLFALLEDLGSKESATLREQR